MTHTLVSPPVLTADHLARWGVCTHEVDRFALLHPDGLPVTVEAAERALAEGFDVHWLADVLTDPERTNFKQVRAYAEIERDQVRALAWAECVRVAAVAWTVCQRTVAPAVAEYERTVAPAEAECEQVVVLALVSALVSCWDEIGGGK